MKLRLCSEDACAVQVVGCRYALHIALTSGTPDILAKFPAACRQKISGHRLPLHLALISRNSDRVVWEILAAFPEACREAESVHNRLPLHWALRNKKPEAL